MKFLHEYQSSDVILMENRDQAAKRPPKLMGREGSFKSGGQLTIHLLTGSVNEVVLLFIEEKKFPVGSQSEFLRETHIIQYFGS